MNIRFTSQKTKLIAASGVLRPKYRPSQANLTKMTFCWDTLLLHAMSFPFRFLSFITTSEGDEEIKLRGIGLRAKRRPYPIPKQQCRQSGGKGQLKSSFLCISTEISWGLGWERGLQQPHSHAPSFAGGIRKRTMQRRPCNCLQLPP